MAANDKYKKVLATASLEQAKAMDKAYTDALAKKKKTYTQGGLEYAVKPEGTARVYAADIVGNRLKTTPTTTTTPVKQKPTTTVVTKTTPNIVARPDSTAKKDSVFAPKPFVKADTVVTKPIAKTVVKTKPDTVYTAPEIKEIVVKPKASTPTSWSPKGNPLVPKEFKGEPVSKVPVAAKVKLETPIARPSSATVSESTKVAPQTYGKKSTPTMNYADITGGLVNQAIEASKEYGTLGINAVKREYAKRFGDDSEAVSKFPTAPIQQPVKLKPDSTAAQKQAAKPILPPAIITGDTINDSGDTYHLPEVIDLTRIKAGARNRGDRTPVASEGVFASAFDDARFISKKDADPEGTYMGVDSQGNIKAGRGKDFSDDAQVIPLPFHENVEGFSKDKNGNYMMSKEDVGDKGFTAPYVYNDKGMIPTNFMTHRGNESDLNTFGNVTGGRIVITSPDMKKQILVSGSVKHIEEQLNKFKKDNGLSKVNLVRLDNGSYSRGFRTKDKHIDEADWREYDNRNVAGGSGFYLLGNGQPKMSMGGIIKKKLATGGNLPKMWTGGYSPAQLDRIQYGFGQPSTTTPAATGGTGITSGMAGTGLQAGSQAINMIDGMDGRPSTLGGVASGAMSGASMGAVGGLPGMAAGAVIGGGLALLQAEQAKKEQKKADKRYMSNLTDQNNFTSQQTLRNYASHGITSAGSYAYGGGIKRPNTNPVSESTLIVKPKIKTGNADYKKLAEQQAKEERRTKAMVETGLNAASYLRMIPTPPTQAIGWGAAGASSLMDINDARVAYNKGDTDTAISEGFGAATNLLPIRNAKYAIPNRNGFFKIIANNMGNINNGINTYNDYNDLKKAGEESLYAYGGDLPEYGKGGKIHIKKANRGKFTAYKKRTGKTTEEALHSKDPHVRKMANFAKNAKKWKHAAGGDLPKKLAAPATAQDSMDLYNNAIEMQDYYRNYVPSPSVKPQGENVFESMDWANQAVADKYAAGTNTRLPEGNRPLAPSEYRQPVDANRFYQRETDHGIIDTRAPMGLYDKRIKPQLKTSYTNNNPADKLKGDKATVYQYDPLAVKPWHSMDTKEQELRAAKYGLPPGINGIAPPQKMPWSTGYEGKPTFPDGGILDKAGRLINEGATKATRAVLPINAAMYAQDLTGNLMKEYTGDNFLTRGKPTPLTEKDLTPEELAVMRQAHHDASYEREKGIERFPNEKFPKELNYDSYPQDKYTTPDPLDIGGLGHAIIDPANRMMTTVGGAMYHKNKKGEDVITDRFNFGGKEEEGLSEASIGLNPYNPYGYLHNFIVKKGSNKEESGIPVNINLGKPKPKTKPMKTGASYFAPKPFNGKKSYAMGGMQEPEYEVEGGEMIQGQPMLEDGQQQQVASDMVKVPDYAPSHAEGGVDGAGGDRVFSDRLKTANKKTYAEEAEQLGKQKAKYEAKIPSTNEAIRNTGERMSERMDMKLDELFNEQEMKKMYAMPSSISSSMPAMRNGGKLPKLYNGLNLKNYPYGTAPGASMNPLPVGWSKDRRSGRPTNYVNKAGMYGQATDAFTNGEFLMPGQMDSTGDFYNTYTNPVMANKRGSMYNTTVEDFIKPKFANVSTDLPPDPVVDTQQRAAIDNLNQVLAPKNTPLGTPTSTSPVGGATKKAMTNGNGIPWQYVDNLASGIATANTPQLAKPYMDPRVDLNTNYDINPQLSSARNTRDAINRSISASTPQGGASAANRQQLFASAVENENSLYAQKNNIENELKNKEILLNSNINSRNNEKRYAYDEQNVARRAGIQEDIVGNASNFAVDQYTSARDAKMDARDLESIKQIAMANPNGANYAYDLKAFGDMYQNDPAKLDAAIAQMQAISPNAPALAYLINMRKNLTGK